MTKSLTAVILFLMGYFITDAQSIENTINLYGNNLPAEKIHIHFDKEIYLPGETVWFKAYVFEENMPTTKSTNFYISLYDVNGKALQQKIYPLINATADGYFDIPDTVKASQLICRAYTTWLLNFDESFLFTKAIPLFNNKSYADTTKKTVSLNFFPEGGDIIEGERNSIAFKANYNNGLPFEMNGVIKKQETGEIIDSIKSIHDGMGRFDIMQQPGERYYAEWVDNTGKPQQTYLPNKKTNGVSLKLVQQNGRLVYNVVNKSSLDSLHVLGYMYQTVIYKTNLLMPSGERYTGSIPLDSFPSGVLQLTVFDNNWQPVAERICFVNNSNYALNTTISYKEISTQKRGKNIIDITMPDTIPANLSLSLTDADFNNEERGTNILTNLLLSGDIRGYIHNPAYYFSGIAGAKEQLDLVMLTHGWRRYNWDNMLTGKRPVINFAPDNYLSVYGQTSTEVLKRIKKEEQVNLLIKTKDSTSRFYFLQPDEKGLLKTNGLIFYDTAKIYYSFNTAKQYNNQMAFSAANYTSVQPVSINNFYEYLIKDTTGTGYKYNAVAALYKYYASKNDSETLRRAKTLERVIVKSGGWHNWKNDPLLKMDEKYTSGMFTGGANTFAFDVLHDEKAWGKLDIYNYLMGKVPGLVVQYPKELGESRIFLLRPSGGMRASVSEAVPVFVDEREVEVTEVENISISQIAYVKILSGYMGMHDAGQGVTRSIIAIYLKKGDDLIDRRPQLTDMGMIKVTGYSPVKEFYSPDYSQTNDAIGNDSRTTLLWLPYIFTGKNNTKIPVTFYNNDFSKRIKIVLEGINDEGKLIHVERIIE